MPALIVAAAANDVEREDEMGSSLLGDIEDSSVDLVLTGILMRAMPAKSATKFKGYSSE